MNAPVLTYRLTPDEPHAFVELTRVMLLHPVQTDDGMRVEGGTSGTVVGIWAHGAAYEVEFLAGLATVEAGNLAVAESIA